MSEPIPDSAVPGVDLIRDLSSTKHPLEDLADNAADWKVIFDESRERLTAIVRAHDPLEMLCRTTSYRMMQELSLGNAKKEKHHFPLEQADVEILHTFVLMHGSENKAVPTSPQNYERLWPTLSKTLFAFSRMEADKTVEAHQTDTALARAKLHTLYYRNNFDRDDCEKILRNILGRLDGISEAELGFRLLDGFNLLIDLTNIIDRRFREFHEHSHAAFEGTDKAEVAAATLFFRRIAPTYAAKLLSTVPTSWDLKTLGYATFQLAEISNAWIYTFDRDELATRYGERLVQFLDEIALSIGALAPANADHIYMNNPIWEKPLITLLGNRIAMPEPYLPLSFPFRVFEPFMAKSKALKEKYEKARAEYLEDNIAEIVSDSLPSAEIYRSVCWTDPDTGTFYENDVMAILGNHYFFFEAKSGRLDDAGRRGAPKSFRENLRDLYVYPGEQASRLQAYLAKMRESAVLTQGRGGPRVPVKLDRPKIVLKFSIVMEHFASLTSCKRGYVDLGLVKPEDAWSPVLSIGELGIISRHLDTEISFFHYLTRRATIEDDFSFTGDEQDLLSLYLTNGFAMDFEALKGVAVTFNDLDLRVRVRKKVRKNRRETEIFGIPVPYHWKKFLAEIYGGPFPYKFDVIEIVLNQSPRNLYELDEKVRKYRKGILSPKEGDSLMSPNRIGRRVFLFTVCLRKVFEGEQEWVAMTRNLTFGEGREKFGATDCATVVVLKKSKSSFDGITVQRYVRPQDAANEVVGGSHMFLPLPNSTA